MAKFAALARAGLLSPRTLAALAIAAAGEGGNPAALLSARARLHPDRLAVDDGAERLTYAELATGVRALAAGLARDHDISAGSRVALRCRDSAAMVRALFAAARLGADVVLLNPEWTPAQVSDLLARQPVDLLIRGEEMGDGGVALPALRSTDARLPRARGGGIAVLTGGTTGAAKVARRQPSPAAMARLFADLIVRLDLGAHRVGLIATPLHHGFGLATLFVGLALGQSLHLRRRFDATEAAAVIAREGVSAVTLVPTMLQRLLDADGLAPLRCIVCGGAPLSPELALAVLDRHGSVLHNLFGTSEAGVSTIAGPVELRAAPGSVGRPLAGVRLRVAGEDGEALPAGETGRVLVRNPVAVAPGWSDTGDLGVIDPAGRLFLRGRGDNMIVSGGENVYPADVEAVLRRHPLVAAAAVVGVADDRFGQRLAAFVVARAPLTADELAEWLADQVARHQRPRDLHLLDALPLTTVGKVDVRRLRALAGGAA